jgi:hypothetical protein
MTLTPIHFNGILGVFSIINGISILLWHSEVLR